jgi:outer membrane protein OmpA-like peptidoglycan-associated protein
MRPTEENSKRCGSPSRHSVPIACAAGLAICLASLLAEKPAAAAEFTFHLEPAVAFWVDKPQSDRFTPGFYLALRPGVAINRVFGVQWSYALLATGSGKNYDENGQAHFLSAGLRLRPFGTLQSASKYLGGMFVDFNFGYVRTGKLDRFGFDAGVGYGFQVLPWLSLGIVLRYNQIVQPDDISGHDPNDAQFMTVGIDLAFGTPYSEEEVEDCFEAPECRPEEEREDPPLQAQLPCPDSCPDADWDGVCDAVDRCPTKIGPPATLGCPIDPCSGDPLIVLVQFDFDSAEMPDLKKKGVQTMDPVLEEVAAAIAQDPTCRVCIIGHASEEGPDAHNDELSQWRATAVQGYMIDHGLAQSVMPTTGFGSNCPLVPDSTLSLNRRVDFLRLLEGESCPVDCLY